MIILGISGCQYGAILGIHVNERATMPRTIHVLDTEYQARLDKLRGKMAANSIDVFVISDRENFEYFSGYKSLFWASKARPFFLIVPQAGDVVVVASASESRAFKQTINRVPGLAHRPYSGFTDACVAVLLDVAAEYAPSRIALDYGFESFGLGSLTLIDAIRSRFTSAALVEGADLIWSIRMIKSKAEIADKRAALKISTDAFNEALSTLRAGTTEKDFAKTLTLGLIDKGADSVPWLPVRFGRGNDFAYSLPPTDRGLEEGDFIWVDIGAIYGESISDVNRIAKAGAVSDIEQKIYTQVRDMTIATLSGIKAGMTGGDVYRAFEKIAAACEIGLPAATASRIGHGGGRNLTEPPSIGPASNEVIEEGMIIHVEPKYELNGGVFQLEEVVVITASGADFLTDLAQEKMPSVVLER